MNINEKNRSFNPTKRQTEEIDLVYAPRFFPHDFDFPSVYFFPSFFCTFRTQSCDRFWHIEDRGWPEPGWFIGTVQGQRRSEANGPAKASSTRACAPTTDLSWISLKYRIMSAILNRHVGKIPWILWKICDFVWNF